MIIAYSLLTQSKLKGVCARYRQLCLSRRLGSTGSPTEFRCAASHIHHHPSILIHAFRTGVESLKVYARGEKSCKDEGSPLYGGLGAHSPRKLLNLETQKCHWGSFLQDIFSKLIRRKMQQLQSQSKLLGHFCLLVPSMLVYTIWSLNRNKQRWEGTGKHGKGKKGVCIKRPNYFCPRLQLFIYPSLVLFARFGVYVKNRGQ